MLSPLPARGRLPGIGGAKIPGSRTNGKLIFASILLPAVASGPPQTRARKIGCIAFITIPSAPAGLCGAGTIDVHRTSRALRFQFSRRRIFAGRIGRRMRRTWNEVHAPAGSHRSVWRSAFLHDGEENLPAGPHRRGSHLRRGLALSPAGGIARRLPESLPLD